MPSCNKVIDRALLKLTTEEGSGVDSSFSCKSGIARVAIGFSLSLDDLAAPSIFVVARIRNVERVEIVGGSVERHL